MIAAHTTQAFLLCDTLSAFRMLSLHCGNFVPPDDTCEVLRVAANKRLCEVNGMITLPSSL